MHRSANFGNASLRRVAASVSFAVALLVSAPSQAALTVDDCLHEAETATGAYELSVKNGTPVADAKAQAQRIFVRRIGDQKGSASKSMTDAIDDCVAAGVGRNQMARAVAAFYP
jgi:hypothetical protein